MMNHFALASFTYLMTTLSIFFLRKISNVTTRVLSVFVLFSLLVSIFNLIYPTPNLFRDFVLGLWFMVFLFRSLEFVTSRSKINYNLIDFVDYFISLIFIQRCRLSKLNWYKNQKESLVFLKRILLKYLGLALLLLINKYIESTVLWKHFFTLGFIYFNTAAIDILSLVATLLGLKSEKIFKLPFLASSPHDFWSKRWNLLVAGWLKKFVFMPTVRRTKNYPLTVMIAFIISGLAHEGLIAIKSNQYVGFTLLFFITQAIGLIIYSAIRKMKTVFLSPWTSVTLHNLWFISSSFLFTYPIERTYQISEHFKAFMPI